MYWVESNGESGGAWWIFELVKSNVGWIVLIDC